MKSLLAFERLDATSRIRVAIAVLIDGKDGLDVLESDVYKGEELKKAGEALLALELDVRFPLIGTMLILAFEEVS